MFKKVLIANRGEIAVRIIRACRDLGIQTIALYELSDQSSLHVRLANEAIRLTSPGGYMDPEGVLLAARAMGADAIHPGYGFLAEDAGFARQCEHAGIVFIGPSSDVLAAVRDTMAARNTVAAAGFATPVYSSESFCIEDLDVIREQAEKIGYPVVVKACRGGRGRGTRLVFEPQHLERAVRQAQAEALAMYGDDHVFVERAILPAHHLEVQILGDHFGNLIHLGEREGSIMRNSQKLLGESPSPSLTQTQRESLWAMALQIARLFNYRNAGTVEFVGDEKGNFYFTEIKARIQVEHPVTEKVTLVDLVREQLRIAAGNPLSIRQEAVQLRGWAMECRINAEDPSNHFLPSPGRLERFRLPGGPNVRVDTYAYSGCEVPVRYDSMLAKLTVWGETREECMNRMRRALDELVIRGVRTTQTLHQRILRDPDFIRGTYSTSFLDRDLEEGTPDFALRDLAIAAAVAYAGRTRAQPSEVPPRLRSGWHRGSRRLPS